MIQTFSTGGNEGGGDGESDAARARPKIELLLGRPNLAHRRKGGGCQSCHDTGFQGRFGIYEVMEVTSAIRRLIYAGAPSHDIRDRSRHEGGMSLRDEGVRCALEGRTSLEEVLRVTHSDDDMSPQDEAMGVAA